MPQPSIPNLVFTPDGLKLVGTGDSTVWLWDLADSGDEPAVLADPGGAASSVAINPSGESLAGGSYDGTVWLWSLAKPAEPTVMAVARGAVFSLTFSPDGRTVATTQSDGSVQVWDLDDPRAEPSIFIGTGPGSSISPIAFSPDGNMLAGGSEGGAVRVWNVDDPAATPQIFAEPGVSPSPSAPTGRPWPGSARMEWCGSGTSPDPART